MSLSGFRLCRRPPSHLGQCSRSGRYSRVALDEHRRSGGPFMHDRSTETLQQEIERLERLVDDMHQQLLQAQKLGSIGMLASSITHEFNNILTTIINYAKMGVRHRDEAI